jgi:hypothetical protein
VATPDDLGPAVDVLFTAAAGRLLTTFTDSTSCHACRCYRRFGRKAGVV